MAENMRVNIGDSVTIQIEGREEEYSSNIQELEEDVFYVYSFIEDLASIGRKIYVSIKKPNCVWLFEAVYMGNVVKGGILLSKFKRTTPLERVQRRNAYRLAIQFSAKLIFDDESVETVRCRDISETGLCFNHKKFLSEGTSMISYFSLGGKEYRLPLEVRRTIPDEDGKGYWIGCKFTEMTQRQAKEIRNSIFRAQVHSGR